MLYTIFGIFLVSPLVLLVASLSRTAVQVSRGSVTTGPAPASVIERSAKAGASLEQTVAAAAPAAAPAAVKKSSSYPRLGGRTRPAVDGGNRRDFFGDRMVAAPAAAAAPAPTMAAAVAEAPAPAMDAPVFEAEVNEDVVVSMPFGRFLRSGSAQQLSKTA